MAPAGHACKHTPHEWHSLWSMTALPPTRRIAPVGQYSRHVPQPLHLDPSIRIIISTNDLYHPPIPRRPLLLALAPDAGGETE